jgi:hypothetical protein
MGAAPVGSLRRQLRRKRGTMKGLLVAALLFVLTASTSLAGPNGARSFHRHLKLTVTVIDNDNSCCVLARHLRGADTIPTFGHLAAGGEYDIVSPPDSPSSYSYLLIQFSDGSGDGFAISGSSPAFDHGAQPPLATWSVIAGSGTGSFANIAGTGTYTADFDANDTTLRTIRLSIDGTLTN